MNKYKAMQNFWEGFGIDVYLAESVPDDVKFPYLTYESKVTNFGESTSMTVNLWYYTASEAIPNAKAEEISRRIGREGITIPCEEGLIWIRKGNPFVQSVIDTDMYVKRRYINCTVQYLTI